MKRLPKKFLHSQLKKNLKFLLKDLDTKKRYYLFKYFVEEMANLYDICCVKATVDNNKNIKSSLLTNFQNNL